MIRLLLVSAVLLSLSWPGVAAPKKAAVKRPVLQSAAPVQTNYRRSPYVGAISVNADTGDVLFEENADRPAYPASVTKLMTLFLVMEDVQSGKYSFDAKVEATADAYKSEPSWVGIRAGEKMSVRDLCTALMVESANDAAIVLGVHSAGSFDAFVARMNARAAELGMKNTKYHNPNGLPPNAAKRYPWKSFNVSTARDQMLLAQKLVKMPAVLDLTSVKTCDLIKTADGFRTAVTRQVNKPNRVTEAGNGERVITQLRNHNNVMVKDALKVWNPDGTEAVDGLKTGYIDAGGSSVVLTGKRKGKRVIVVVLGSSSAAERDANARRLLTDALGALVW